MAALLWNTRLDEHERCAALGFIHGRVTLYHLPKMMIQGGQTLFHRPCHRWRNIEEWQQKSLMRIRGEPVPGSAIQNGSDLFRQLGLRWRNVEQKRTSRLIGSATFLAPVSNLTCRHSAILSTGVTLISPRTTICVCMGLPSSPEENATRLASAKCINGPVF